MNTEITEMCMFSIRSLLPWLRMIMALITLSSLAVLLTYRTWNKRLSWDRSSQQTYRQFFSFLPTNRICFHHGCCQGICVHTTCFVWSLSALRINSVNMKSFCTQFNITFKQPNSTFSEYNALSRRMVLSCASCLSLYKFPLFRTWAVTDTEYLRANYVVIKVLMNINELHKDLIYTILSLRKQFVLGTIDSSWQLLDKSGIFC